MSTFDTLGLADSLVRAVRAEGYETPTPIQLKAIGPLLAGHDLMGCAQTGTGKTAAFALPTLQRLSVGSGAPALENGSGRNGDAKRRPAKSRRPIRALILAPTRELAAQIGASFTTYGKFTGLRCAVVYGGVGQGPQVRALQHGVDILVATPGRLEDLMEQGHIDLRHVEILILDEADQMLDMGFIVPLRRIVSAVPRERQTLMFSATMPPEIRKLTSEWLRNPTYVEVAPVLATTELVEQSVHFAEPNEKVELLMHYLENTAFTRALVFARTKHGADKIVKRLSRDGIRAAALHSNKSQSVRQRTLAAFKSSKPPVLVATDIAARGLDVDAISHVVNYDLPQVAEVYVHRIGRTGRAGATGIATSFCSRDERGLLRQVERLMQRKLAVVGDEPAFMKEPSPVNGNAHGSTQRNGRGRGPRGGQSHGERPSNGRKRSRRGNQAAARNGSPTNGVSRTASAAPAGQPAKRQARSGKRRILAGL